MVDNALPALGLSFLAGLATTIGGVLCIYIGRESSVKMGVALALTAGVMLYVSFMELLPEGQLLLSSSFPNISILLILHCLILALIVIFFLEKSHKKCLSEEALFYKSSLFIVVSLTLHNFPEGMATLASTLADFKLGLVSAFAIAMHNIPEGLAIAVPIYKLTGNYKKAIFYSFLSGMAEPMGALIGLFFLNQFMNEAVLGAILCGIATIMIYISMIQIIPLARGMARISIVTMATLAGMLLMGVSITLFTLY